MLWRKAKDSNLRDVVPGTVFNAASPPMALPSPGGIARADHREVTPADRLSWSRMQDSNPRRLFTRQVLWPVELIRPW